ncbi:MAG: hypothetical protein ACI9UA_001990 [Pseudoalteromonas tetraodonis]|jgi:hypothetical protein
MIKTLSLSITVAVSMAAVAQASIITLSAGRTGPLVITSADGSAVSSGLVRIGTLTGAPASPAVADIDAVFSEFGTATTSATGGLGTTVSNPAGTPFDGQQVYIWVFSGSDMSSAEHAVFTVADKDAPDAGDPWTFAAHTGTGTDGGTVTLSALLTGADTSITPGVSFSSASGGRLILTPVPEPSGALLAGLGCALIAFRRRR